MTEVLTDKIKEHIKENIVSYILLFLFFIIGAVFGGYITKTYKSEDISTLKNFFEEAFNIFKGGTPDYNSIFKNTFTSGLKDVFFIWLLGFTVIGLPIIFFMTAKAGFMLGFISTFIISFYSGSGILLSVILIFAKCFIYMPLVFVISAYGISLSKLLTKMLIGKIKYRMNFKYYILSYVIIFAAAVLVVILYSLLETYLTANLLTFVTVYI